ncbi:putative E3 ubiquitin-protein ligase RF298 [Salvia hispanica]|uniref:putative E3 ubiquitin-protein ligase RF298 n=1 Tax=Salvia hispanica TaxID=49212 RepID=UPI00200958C0|nr:putative E3 ubiquitin-protein ligase RF298 [Salvia hispanica]XP_047948288.1 putative E3 ubiquitin-protein ligase RF298 [Salvia hispanica]XP_047948289.1 putative E3 ubiquitin-protein ligase RF298 [Salvia hispanica]
MASMVAKACGSTSSQMPVMTVQEKGSRNKRKFRADPPLADPNKAIPLPSNECTSFEFSAEKYESQGHMNGCDMCCINQDSSDHSLKLDLGLSCAVGMSEIGLSRPREDIEVSADEFRDADWSDLTESELEELVLSNLDTIFKSAVKKIIASGYSEEVATRAILRSGLWYGCKDIVSNIVENTLGFLRSGQEIDPSKEHYFEDLQQMKKYILAELVCLLREVRPFFSTGDAMWCLLICDMNVSHACSLDGDSFVGDASSNMNPSVSAQSQLRSELKSSEYNNLVPCKPDASIPHDHSCPSEAAHLASVHGDHSFQSETPKITSGPNSKLKTSLVSNGLAQDKDSHNSASNASEKPFTASGVSTVAEEKFFGSRKVSAITKREYILRQKSMHFEKHYRTYGSKGASRSGKLSSFSGLVLDKKLKGVAESAGINAKNGPLKINNKGVGFDVTPDNVSRNLPTTTAFTSAPTFGLEANDQSLLPKSSISSALPLVPVNASPSLPVADTELSLSFPAKSIANPMPISYNIEAANCSYLGLSSNKSLGQWGPQDRKDEMIMKLYPRLKELQNQLQEWTEWANQKVMQAARRLGKDKAELKTLKQEKEEVERLKKEKQTLEENTMKKLSEMESALCKASGQVERANAAVRRLNVENSALRREMEAAKVRAAESAASCQEVSKREKKTLMKFQSWEKQKNVFQEELSAEKLKLTQMQQKLKQATDVHDQVEAKLNQEEQAKCELLTQVSSLKKEREQIEVSTQSKEDMIKSRAENNLQKYKDDIATLEKEISQLRLKTDSSKIAALRRGVDGSYANKLTDFRDTELLKDSAISYISKMVAATDLHGFSKNGGVKRERECVMCLSEEMSVVFLPCAHQVVCTMCNELHEKQGMKDCPSCRGPILRRVCVRYALP